MTQSIKFHMFRNTILPHVQYMYKCTCMYHLPYSFGGSDGHKALHRASAGGQIFDGGRLHRKVLEWTF